MTAEVKREQHDPATDVPDNDVPSSPVPARTEHSDIFEINTMAVGGEAVGRLANGRVLFVGGALPGERVTVEITEKRRDFYRAVARDVIVASPIRVEPPCPRVAAGCGGCQWQHIDPLAQVDMKRRVLKTEMRRAGRLTRAVADRIRSAPPMPPFGYRTTVRAAVDPSTGRAGFYRHRGHEVCITGPCAVAHPIVSRVLDEGRFRGAEQVLVRYGIASGELGVVAYGDEPTVRLPGSLQRLRTPDNVVHETVGGVSFRISPGSFFQARPDGAEALVALVRAAVAPWEQTPLNRLVDLYSGVGLFAATAGRRFRTYSIEGSRSAHDDAKHNLPPYARVIATDVWQWYPPDFRSTGMPTVVIADPARIGLRAKGVRTVLRCAPVLLVLVSCDTASFVRDAALLLEAGYDMTEATVVDMFPQSFHTEIVSVFVPTDRAAGGASDRAAVRAGSIDLTAGTGSTGEVSRTTLDDDDLIAQEVDVVAPGDAG